MEKHQKLGLALIAAGCALAAFCGLGLYYVNQRDTMPAMTGATAAPAGTPVPTAEPTAAPNAAPVLTLIGDDPLFYPAQPGGYEDPGCTAIDDRDGDITAKIECAADVNAFHTGEGSVTYSVTDSDGMTATITRRVIVTAADRPIRSRRRRERSISRLTTGLPPIRSIFWIFWMPMASRRRFS